MTKTSTKKCERNCSYSINDPSEIYHPHFELLLRFTKLHRALAQCFTVKPGSISISDHSHCFVHHWLATANNCGAEAALERLATKEADCIPLVETKARSENMGYLLTFVRGHVQFESFAYNCFFVLHFFLITLEKYLCS